jgi:hypothetical protein
MKYTKDQKYLAAGILSLTKGRLNGMFKKATA